METTLVIARSLLVVWCLLCSVTTTRSFVEGKEIVVSDEAEAPLDAVVGGLLLHPKAPPPPLMEDTPLNSTRLSVELDDGFEWVVVIEDDVPEAELRALLNGICEETGQRNLKRGTRYAAEWISIKSGYDRTTFWFEESGARDVFTMYLSGLMSSAADRAINALEVGSFEGGSAVWFATHLLSHPESVLLCLDTWTGGDDFKNNSFDMPTVEDRFRRNIAKTPNGERVMAVKGDSMLTLSKLVAGGASSTFDVVYVDGSHSAVNVLSDGLLSFRLLKVGGVIIFDDIVSFPDVGIATDMLVKALEAEGGLEVLHREEQLVLRKTAEDRWATPDSATIMGNRPYPSLAAGVLTGTSPS